jgi:hypothetical protein
MRRLAITGGMPLCVLLALAPAIEAQREPAVPKELLERVSAGAERFLAEYQNFAVVETLQQTVWSRSGRAGQKRQIISEFWRLRLAAGPREAVEFRDVVSVDGKASQDAAARELKHAKITLTATRSEIAALVEDPTKYRLGAERLANAAMLATRLLERHHDKLRFFFAQDTSDVPSETVLIGYRQYSGEGLIEVDGTAVFPSGQTWVDPNRGRIHRIEEEFQHKGTRYWAAVEFSPAEPLGAWMPQQITVRVFEKGKLAREDVYQYANYRRVGADGRADAATEPPRPRP